MLNYLAAKATKDSAAADVDKSQTLVQLTKSYENTTAAIAASTQSQVAALKARQAAGEVSAVDAQDKLAAIETAGYQKRIAADSELEAELQAKLAKIRNNPDAARDIQAQIAKVETDSANARLAINEAKIQERARIESKFTDAFRLENEKQSRIVENTQNQALADVKLSVAQRLLTESDAQVAIAKIQEQAATQRLAEAEREAKALADSKSKFSDPKKFSDLQIAADQKVAAARIALENSTAERIKASEEGIINATVAGYNRELSALSVVEHSLSSQLTLQQGNAGLAAARAAVDEATSKRRVSNLQEALTLNQELASGQLKSAAERQVAEQRLSQLGIQSGASQLEITQQIAAEDAILAAQKTAALAAEQVAERASLELDIQKNALAARRLEIEVEIAIAEAKKPGASPEQLAAAQDLLAIAREEEATVAQSADIQRQTLTVKQQGAKAELDASNSATAYKDDMAVAKADAQDTATSTEKISSNLKDASSSAKEMSGNINDSTVSMAGLVNNLKDAKIGFSLLTGGGPNGGSSGAAIRTVDPNELKKQELQLEESLATTKEEKDKIKAELDAMKKSDDEAALKQLRSEISLNDELLRIRKELLGSSQDYANAIKQLQSLGGGDLAKYAEHPYAGQNLLGSHQPSNFPSFADGVTDFNGGLAYVHQGELLANLPKGTDVMSLAQIREARNAYNSTTNNKTSSNNTTINVIDRQNPQRDITNALLALTK